jgi:SagB-type dehydrogenase family enzyme
MKLPPPRRKGPLSLEETLWRRRSVREYSEEPLTLEEVGQILWSAQGVTHPEGYRTAPSAGALYPLEVYVHANRVKDLEKGIYRYDPFSHSLQTVKKGDFSRDIFETALWQWQILEAGMILIFFAVPERTTGKYGRRGIRYILNEVGHAGQNVYLQATALGLGSVVIGAFEDERLKRIVGVDQEPLYIMTVGRPKTP